MWPSAVKTQSPNHWTSRKLPVARSFILVRKDMLAKNFILSWKLVSVSQGSCGLTQRSKGFCKSFRHHDVANGTNIWMWYTCPQIMAHQHQFGQRKRCQRQKPLVPFKGSKGGSGPGLSPCLAHHLPLSLHIIFSLRTSLSLSKLPPLMRTPVMLARSPSNVVIPWLSRIQLFTTPGTAAREAPRSSTACRVCSDESMMLSSHLILCCPPSPFALNLSQHQVFPSESGLQLRWPNCWSFSFSISPSNEHSGWISFRFGPPLMTSL